MPGPSLLRVKYTRSNQHHDKCLRLMMIKLAASSNATAIATTIYPRVLNKALSSGSGKGRSSPRTLG